MPLQINFDACIVNGWQRSIFWHLWSNIHVISCPCQLDHQEISLVYICSIHRSVSLIYVQQLIDIFWKWTGSNSIAETLSISFCHQTLFKCHVTEESSVWLPNQIHPYYNIRHLLCLQEAIYYNLCRFKDSSDEINNFWWIFVTWLWLV